MLHQSHIDVQQPKSVDSKHSQLTEALKHLYEYLTSLHEESKRAPPGKVVLEDESLLNFHISLILSKMGNQSPSLKQAITEHCNFVYLALMLLFKRTCYSSVAKDLNLQNKKSADFILENVIENSFILM